MKDNTAAVHAQVPVDVATYLLNEKRSDLTKLEARLKVSIALIPNKFLETPHYSIERLKHDDERLDQVKPSYDRVVAPMEEQTYSVAKSADDARARRQEAVVKGVVPETPAPVVTVELPLPAAVAATPSLWSRFVAWLTGPSTPAPVKAAAAPVAAPAAASRGRPERDRRGRGERRPDRHDGRPERGGGERGGQGRGERQDRGERASGRDQTPRRERPASATARPEGNEERSKRRGRGGEGSGRPQREGRAQDSTRDGDSVREAPAPLAALAPEPAGAPSAPAADAAGGEERRGRRRRRRGRGSDRGDRAGPATVNEAVSSRDLDEDDSSAPVAAEVESEPVEMPVAAAPARREEVPAARPIEPAPMAVAELLPIVESSGMTLAQTDPQKLAAAQARAAAMQPAPARVGRERPVLPPIEEAPLTQVETRDHP
jgi:ribonuclease E